MRTYLVLVAGLAGLLACANPYVDNYQNTLSQWPGGEASRLLPGTGPAKLVTSANMQADTLAMMENGFLLVGRSTFRSTVIDENMALKEAERLGASVVLVGKEYVNSVTQSVPVTTWIPPAQVTYTERVTDNSSMPQRGYDRIVTKTIEGEYHTRYVPQNVDYYAYSATYWAKSKPPIFGVLVQALDDGEKKSIGSSKGVVVKAVIKGSPAFDADILCDDIIVQMDDAAVPDPDGFFDMVITNAGKPVALQIVRNGNRLTKNLTIRKEDK